MLFFCIFCYIPSNSLVYEEEWHAYVTHGFTLLLRCFYISGHPLTTAREWTEKSLSGNFNKLGINTDFLAHVMHNRKGKKLNLYNRLCKVL